MAILKEMNKCKTVAEQVTVLHCVSPWAPLRAALQIIWQRASTNPKQGIQQQSDKAWLAGTVGRAFFVFAPCLCHSLPWDVHLALFLVSFPYRVKMELPRQACNYILTLFYPLLIHFNDMGGFKSMILIILLWFFYLSEAALRSPCRWKTAG